MFKHFCMAGLLALGACVNTPAGFDAAQWHKDRRACIAEARQASMKAASAWQLTAPLLGGFAGGAVGGALVGQATGFASSAATTTDENPLGAKWIDEREDKCLVARGYPAGSDPSLGR